jgi:WD40 repeat protein
VHTLEGHRSAVYAVAVSPDGKHAVSGSEDDTLKVWDLSTGEEVTSFIGESQIYACSIAPNRNTIVGGGLSGKLHILQLEGI